MTETGLGLTIIIESNYTFSGDWMAFACWYSISKMMPDAEVRLSVTKVSKIDRPLFAWANKVGIKHYNKDDLNKKTIFLDCAIIMVRELNDNFLNALDINTESSVPEELISTAHQDGYVPFVEYRSGCGNFFMAEWIDIAECPFSWADKFMTAEATVNEIKVLKLWKQMGPLYATLSRG